MAARTRKAAEDAISVVPADEAGWDDLQAVFGPRGYAARCQWIRHGQWRSVSAAERTARLREQIGCGRRTRDGKPVNHQVTDHLSITQSQVPSSWRRATSEVMSPSKLCVEVRARSPQMSAGRCFPSLNLRPSGPNPVTWRLVKNS